MYTKRIYSPKLMLWWTRHETLLFIGISSLAVLLYSVLEQRWAHIPWLPVALVGTAVAFILSFQNNAAYGRLWEARKIWGGIVNASRAWGIMVKDFITNDFSDEKASKEELQAIHKALIMRHVAWLTALRHALRQPRPWEDFARHRSNREWTEAMQVREHTTDLVDELKSYVAEGECARVSHKANVPAQILALQSEQLRELRTRGLIDDFRHMEMQRVLVELYGGQGKSERIKNFPYPRQYATLNSLFMWIFVLLLPFGLVGAFDEIGQGLRATNPTLSDHFVWFTVPFSTIVMWIFHTMERIGRVSENPFEGSANDVPITTMARGIEIDLREMLNEDPSTIPGPIESRQDTQM
jgi:putative membrane protein